MFYTKCRVFLNDKHYCVFKRVCASNMTFPTSLPSSLGFPIRFQRGLVGSAHHGGSFRVYEAPGVDAEQGVLPLQQSWHRVLAVKRKPEACHIPAEILPGN